MSSEKEQEAKEVSRNSTDGSQFIGLCLHCGCRLTFCGKPFTAYIVCRKCLTINRYEGSLQPVSTG